MNMENSVINIQIEDIHIGSKIAFDHLDVHRTIYFTLVMPLKLKYEQLLHGSLRYQFEEV